MVILNADLNISVNYKTGWLIILQLQHILLRVYSYFIIISMDPNMIWFVFPPYKYYYKQREQLFVRTNERTRKQVCSTWTMEKKTGD